MWKFWLRFTLALELCCGGLCITAQAKNFMYSANPNSHSWTGGLSQNIALTGKGDKSLPFSIPSNGLVAVAFSAECQLIGSRQSFISVDIVVDGTVVPITAGDDAFCAGRGAGVRRLGDAFCYCCNAPVVRAPHAAGAGGSDRNPQWRQAR